MDLKLPDPGDDDELLFLIEALHQDGGDAPGSDGDLAAVGEGPAAAARDDAPDRGPADPGR